MITRKRMFLYNFGHVNEKQEDKEIKKKTTTITEVYNLSDK